MPDLKFSCPQCGQHISCDELWSSHQIQCPACRNTVSVPQATAPPDPTPPASTSLVPQPPTYNRPKLSAGVTQVARSSPAGPAPQKRNLPRPPKTTNPAIKYAFIALLLLAVGGAAFVYLPGLLSQVHDIGASKTSTPGTTSGGGNGVGPMGEVNGAMDVSDALDGGGSASRPRVSIPRPATNGVPKSANSPQRNR